MVLRDLQNICIKTLNVVDGNGMDFVGIYHVK